MGVAILRPPIIQVVADAIRPYAAVSVAREPSAISSCAQEPTFVIVFDRPGSETPNGHRR